MTPIERQILKNQEDILISLYKLSNNEDIKGWLDNRTAETIDLLFEEKESKESCCEMPKNDAKSKQDEVKE